MYPDKSYPNRAGSMQDSMCRSEHEEIDLISEEELLLSSAPAEVFPVR